MDTVMSITEQRKYLYKMQQRYREANRSERGGLPNEMERVAEKHRTHPLHSLERDYGASGLLTAPTTATITPYVKGGGSLGPIGIVVRCPVSSPR